ncbi:hypothetical protein ACHAXS_001247 [Conticribra weissflogii]
MSDHHQNDLLQQTHPLVIEHLRTMLNQEQTTYRYPSDFLSYSQRRPLRSRHLDVPSISEDDRRAMCQWGMEIVDACQIDRSAACCAISYFDRFLDTNSKQAKMALLSKRIFQLSFISCLVIALKCRAGMVIDSDFVSGIICQNLYDQEELFEAEREILQALQWRVNGPSPRDFIRYFMELMPSIIKVNSPELLARLTRMAETRADCALLDYSIVTSTPPSAIALAAVWSAMRSTTVKEFHPLDRLAFTQSIDMITGVSIDDRNVQLVHNSINDLVPGESTYKTRVSFDGVDQFDNHPLDASAKCSSPHLLHREICYTQFPESDDPMPLCYF